MARDVMTAIINRLPLPEREIKDAMHHKHFFTAKVTKQEVVSDLYNALIDARKDSTDVSAWQLKAMEVLKKHKLTRTPDQTTQDWDKYQNDVKNLDSLARLRLIFRTNTMAAASLTRYTDGMSPENLRSFPCWEFVRIQGAKEPRPLHVKNEGAIREKWDKQFWAHEMNARSIGGFELPYAPFGYNSYMEINPVHYSQCPKDIQDKVDKMTDDDYSRVSQEMGDKYGVDLVGGYEKNPYPMSTKKLKPEQRKKIIEELEKEGIEVKQDDDEVKIDLRPKKKANDQGSVTFELDKETKKKLERKNTPKDEPEKPRKPEPAKTRKQAVENTKLLLDDADSGVAKWSPSIKKETINESNDALFDLKEKYPIVNINRLGSYKDRSDNTGAHAGRTKLWGERGYMLELNHDSKEGGIHGLKGWKPYNHQRTQKEIESLELNISKYEKIAKDPNTSSRYRRDIKTYLRQAKEAIEYKKEKLNYTRHNVGATEEGMSLADLMRHEYAHMLHYSRVDTRDDALALVRDQFEKAKNNKDIYKISHYAASNEMEFFAEVFTMFDRGDDLPKYLRQMVERILKMKQYGKI